MKNLLITIILAATLFSTYSNAQTNTTQTTDKNAITKVVRNIEKAWAAGDAETFADNFTNDVDYTVWNGLYIKGRGENVSGHQRIFDTFYKGTKTKSDIRQIRFLSEKIATAHLKSKMFRDGKQVPNVPTVFPLLVLKKENKTWKIIVFHNTPEIKRGDLNVKSAEN